MQRSPSYLVVNLLMILTLSLMVLAVSLPGCQPPTQVKEKTSDFEIKQQDGHIKIDIDRDGNGGLKVDIQKKEKPTQDAKESEDDKAKASEPSTTP